MTEDELENIKIDIMHKFKSMSATEHLLVSVIINYMNERGYLTAQKEEIR